VTRQLRICCLSTCCLDVELSHRLSSSRRASRCDRSKSLGGSTRKRVRLFSLSSFQSTHILKTLCDCFHAAVESAHALRRATGSHFVAADFRRSLRLESLESRQLLAADISVNDNWHLVTDNAPFGSVSVGDIVRNSNDTIAPGTIDKTYGVDGYGLVTTGFPTGFVPATDSIQDAINDVDPAGNVRVLEGTFMENLLVSKVVNLLGAQSGVDARGRAAAESILTPLVPATTTIDLTTGSGANVIDGFTLTGGTALGMIRSTVSAVNNNLQIKNNQFASFTGAAIFLDKPGDDITIHQKQRSIWATHISVAFRLPARTNSILNSLLTIRSPSSGQAPLAQSGT
jgi:hypothetical protein